MQVQSKTRNSEANFIQQAQAGNDIAFGKLVNQYKDLVFRTCIGFVHNDDDANDITQEVFIQMYKSIDSFRGDSKLSTWLYRIAVNKSLNAIRNKKSKSWLQSIERIFGVEKKTIEFTDSFADTASYAENNDRAKAIKQAMATLPETQRTAFVLSKYEDLSYAEIAEVMQVSISSVESLLFRAKSNLQKKLVHIYKNL